MGYGDRQSVGGMIRPGLALKIEQNLHILLDGLFVRGFRSGDGVFYLVRAVHTQRKGVLGKAHRDDSLSLRDRKRAGHVPGKIKLLHGGLTRLEFLKDGHKPVVNRKKTNPMLLGGRGLNHSVTYETNIVSLGIDYTETCMSKPRIDSNHAPFSHFQSQ